MKATAARTMIPTTTGVLSFEKLFRILWHNGLSSSFLMSTFPEIEWD